MALEFKSRTGKVKAKGSNLDFARLVATRRGASGGEATFTFTKDNGASQPDKLVFWGTGAEIAKLLQENQFVARTAESSGLRLEVRWLPITKKGGRKMAEAAIKAVAKEGAQLAGKAVLGVATHGVAPAVEFTATAIKMAKTAVKAAKGEIKVTPQNLDLDWEARIVINKGIGDADGVVGLLERCQDLGAAPDSGHMYALFKTAMEKYSASLKNAMLLGKGEHLYDRLLDDDDVAASLARSATSAEGTASVVTRQVVTMLREKIDRPDRAQFQQLGNEGDD